MEFMTPENVRRAVKLLDDRVYFRKKIQQAISSYNCINCVDVMIYNGSDGFTQRLESQDKEDANYIREAIAHILQKRLDKVEFQLRELGVAV